MIFPFLSYSARLVCVYRGVRGMQSVCARRLLAFCGTCEFWDSRWLVTSIGSVLVCLVHVLDRCMCPFSPLWRCRFSKRPLFALRCALSRLLAMRDPAEGPACRLRRFAPRLQGVRGASGGDLRLCRLLPPWVICVLASFRSAGGTCCSVPRAPRFPLRGDLVPGVVSVPSVSVRGGAGSVFRRRCAPMRE